MTGLKYLGQGQNFGSGPKFWVWSKHFGLGAKFCVGGKMLGWGQNFGPGKILRARPIFWVRAIIWVGSNDYG